MSLTSTVTSPARPPTDPEQRIDLFGIGWDRYVAITDAMGEQRGVKCIYLDGRLTLLTPSRKHDWHAERLAELFKAVSTGLGILWEDSGSATYRLKGKGSGVEGDKIFYVGTNAERMLGPRNIDLTSQPPPDVAIEVEVSHHADEVMQIYGRLEVPEVWRFDVEAMTFGFWVRREDGTYSLSGHSLAFPILQPADVLAQMRRAEELGAARWCEQLRDWVRDTLLPRLADGA